MLFEHEMRLQKKALNSCFCLQSFSAFQLPLASHSAHQLWLHIVHSGSLSYVNFIICDGDTLYLLLFALFL